MSKDFFPQKPDVNPTIYAYELIGVDSHKGLLKVGYTIRNAQDRVAEQLKTSRLKYKIVLEETAIRNDGTTFTDHEVHQHLKRRSIKKKDGEWFKCTVRDIKSTINDVKNRKFSVQTREHNFKMRPDQKAAGKNKSTGGVKTKNEWVHKIKWDCIVFDEYHYGAWRENAKELFEAEDKKEKEFAEGKGLEYLDEKTLPIKTEAYLYLSGTPFRAIASGEFIEEQIYNWTYSDEQKAKNSWNDKKGSNPYAPLPRMVMMTYQLPDSIREIAMQGEFNEFDLNLFFSAEGKGKNAKFAYEDEVQKWLNLIRGSFLETTIDNLKLGAKKPPMPFSHAELLSILNHTLWFLPSVASCHAMHNLLKQKHNTFYSNYKVIVAAGQGAGIGIRALPPVLEVMDDPLESKTITLTCGKLLTGVTVKPWTGIFMLRNCSTPETYFQAAFRVQSPWTVKNPDNKSPNKEEIIKQECYVFDFAPNRE